MDPQTLELITRLSSASVSTLSLIALVIVWRKLTALEAETRTQLLGLMTKYEAHLTETVRVLTQVLEHLRETD